MTIFHVNTTEGHDYTYEMYAHNLDTVREQSSQRLAQAMQEAEILLEAFLDVTMEAGVVGTAAKAPAAATKAGYKATKTVTSGAQSVRNGVTKAGRKAKDIVAKIVQFFKNLYARFMDNMKTLFQNNTKWLEERKDEFAKFDYTDLATEMVPYWGGKIDINAFRMVNAKLGAVAIRKILGNSKSIDDFNKLSNFQQTHMKEYLDSDNDLTEGLKNHFRVGAPAGKDRVKLQGNNLKNIVVNTFIPTILKYDKQVMDANAQLILINRDLTTIGTEIDRRGLEVKESALFGRDFMDTEVAVHENLIAVFEADNNDQKKNTNVKDSSDSNRTKVEVSKDGRNESEKSVDAYDEKTKKLVSNTNDNMLHLLNNVASTQQLVVTSYLTVMEERYTAYMNALKSIWKVSNTVGGRNTPKEEK